MKSSVRSLVEVVGGARVSTDPAVVAGFARDWTGRYGGLPSALVRPVSTDQVAEVVRWCVSTGTPLVPQGGNTGLVGGGVPRGGELLLSLRGMGSRLSVDVAAAQVTASAGVTIGRLQAAARAHGLVYGVDLASRDSATVGGTIATNAGGLRVPRYGDTRAQVVGVEAVLSDGTVVSHLGGLVRDNTGYHLPSLLAGSEGTLAVITAARLRLVRPTGSSAVALVGFDSVASAVAAAARLRVALVGVAAVELFLPSGLALVRRHTGLPAPIAGDAAAYLVLECEGAAPVDALEDAVTPLVGVRDVAVASDTAGRTSLWAYRERHTEAIASLGAAVKMDVTLPPAAVVDFLRRVAEVVDAVRPGSATWLFGHVGDGNVHVNVTGADSAADLVQDAVYRLVGYLGGSISTEHGIGVAKRRWLHLNRSAEEIEVFRRIKAALDPAGIFNPGVLLPEPVESA